MFLTTSDRPNVQAVYLYRLLFFLSTSAFCVFVSLTLFYISYELKKDKKKKGVVSTHRFDEVNHDEILIQAPVLLLCRRSINFLFFFYHSYVSLSIDILSKSRLCKAIK